MKSSFTIVVMLVAAFLFASCTSGTHYQPQNGDIIFQSSRSNQSLAIARATHSPYTHMGIVYLRNGRPVVFEAVGPVISSDLSTWIARGEEGRYVVKRLRNADEILTPEALERMYAAGRAFAGKPYDLYFEWSDDRLYCSELVWKVYNRALGLELGRLQTMKEFDFSDPVVQEKARERFGDHLPLDETVISPAAIFASDLLTTVYEK